ncbi:unnamed protein product [Bursaphelenchus xylophilus]|uniref:(pine wood nematode) hypothetical protein n=1 Tax=Bursaphelenchus xylophilus TaxID=6326 RepID=A0A1I7RTI3_BURXY|nr:unnamed protein product [Bursaphelenchus xylophilus]CAG9122441.1 unnamed protein product [Bursaphelenchus xylophilus]
MRDKTLLFVLLYIAFGGLVRGQSSSTGSSTVQTTFPQSTPAPLSSSSLTSTSSPSSLLPTATTAKANSTTSSGNSTIKSHSSFAACSNSAALNASVENWNPNLGDVKDLLCYTGVTQKDHYNSYDDCYSDVAYCNLRYLQKQVRKACEDDGYTFTLRRWWFWLLVIGVPIILAFLIITTAVSILVCFCGCCCRPSGFNSYDNKIYSVDTAPPIPVSYGGRVYSSAF